MRVWQNWICRTVLGVGSVCVAATVPESPRDLPRLANVDVVVVGGTVAGVQAAATAKAAGASVFLVAPRFQLGEEIVTTRSLWLDDADEGENDAFVLDLFSSERSTPYTYTYNKTPNAGHADDGLTRLRDGVVSSAATESVQFDDDVTVTADLGPAAGRLLSLRLSAYRRTATGGFVTGTVTVEGSVDGSVWTTLEGTLTRTNEVVPGESDTLDVFTFMPSQEVSPVYLKISCARASGYSRQLLGELKIVTTSASPSPARPLLVAKALDQVLLDADVPFLTGSPATDVLHDGSGRIAGVTVANRNGRQAIQAKVVIDATEWSAVARAAGVPFVSGTDTTRFTRTVICRKGDLDELLPSSEGWQIVEKQCPQASVSCVPGDLKGTDAPESFTAAAYLVSRTFPFANLTYAGWLEIEHQMRDAIWTKSVSDVSEKCAFTLPDHITGVATAGEWTSAADLSLDALRPSGVAGLYVLGPGADVARADAAKLQLAGVETIVGRRVGAAAADEAAAVSLSDTVGLGVAPSEGSAQVHERLTRPLNVGTEDGSTVPSLGANLPILAEVDVLVVGGGTAGVPATLAAAGEGRSVLMADILYVLGGVPVDNRIGRYYHGNIRGFATNLTAQVKAHGWQFYAACPDWQRKACREAAADVWFGAFAEGVVTDGGDGAGRARVTGAVFVLPDGTRGVVRAKATIDATGNADLTAAAGGATTFLDGPEFAGQGVGASNIQLGNSYLNTDVGFLNDADAGDMSHFMLRSRLALQASWMQPSFPATGSRERRRIVGDVTVTELDIVRGRTWPDTIMHGLSNFDMHGFSTSPLLMFWVHPSEDLAADLPFRALLPQGLEGILATGLGISATRDAMPIIRMQRDVQNQGWAAGLAASAACDNGNTLRTIDIKALQRALVAADILDERVIEDVDGGTVSTLELDDAIAGLNTNYRGLETILAADPEVVLPKLRAAYAVATSVNRQVPLGTTLALLGDATAVDYLVSRYSTSNWDTGYNFKGLGNYGRQTSVLDGALYALAQTRDPRVLPLIASLAGTLASDDGSRRTLSHFRMVNLAVQAYPAAALAESVLSAVDKARETLRGNAFATVQPASYVEDDANEERTLAITELALAETLLRLGDPDGSGRQSLEAFAVDPRASYATWARRLLATEIPAPLTDTDTVWTSTATAGNWSDAANWRNSQQPEGSTALATFEGLSAGARQTVNLPEEGVTIGSLALTDAADRTFAGGPLSLLSPTAFLDVAGGSLTFENALKASGLEKKGEGAAVLAGPVEVANQLKVSEGTVRLANGAASQAVAGSSFTVGQDAVWITHLGCRADEVEALVANDTRLRIVLVASNGTRIEAVLFTARHQGFVEGGYRYLRLANPRQLVAGSTYTLQASASNRHLGVLLAEKNPEQSFSRVQVNGRLELGSPFTTFGSMAGTGVVSTVASAPVGLNLDIASGLSTTFNGRLEQADAAPLSVTKQGDGTATLKGIEGLRDGVSPRRGILMLDSPAVLHPEATIIFGTRDGVNGAKGRLAFADSDAVVSNPVACAKMYGYNTLDNGFLAEAGKRLTLRDVEVTTPDSTCNDGGVAGTLALIASYSTQATVVAAENTVFPYIDLTAQVYGNQKDATRGANAVTMRNVSSPEKLRKLTVLNTVSNSVGGTLTISESSLKSDWVDFSGPYVGFNLSTGATLVANSVRFPNNNSVQHSNADILIDGGARFVANGIPTSDATAGNRTTNTVLRFDHGILQLKSEHNGDFIPLSAENPPMEILAGGLTLDLSAYDVAATNGYPYRSLRIRHPMTSPEEGVPGPLTILGGDPSGPSNGGECKLAAPMSFNGPITVKGGSLVCDFKAATTLESILKPGMDLVLDGGAFDLQSETAGRVESFAAITNAGAVSVPIKIADGCRVETSMLVGEGGFTVKGGTVKLDLPMSGDQLLNGPLVLDGATLTVSTQMLDVEPTLVPGGSFEPTPEALPVPVSGNTGSLDKRGTRDASWLKKNVSDWMFDADNNVGVARNGSYFTSDVTNGVTCAFLRGTSGTIRRTFMVERAARYTLLFDWKGRLYGGTQYTAQIRVSCDGTVVHTTDAVKQSTWVTTSVDLGILSPGEHTIAFGSVVANGDALLDNVRLGYVAKPTQADLERIISPELSIDLRNGAMLDLGFEGRLPVAGIRIDGAKRYGVFSADSLPGQISGTGSFVCLPKSTLIIFR